MAESASSEHDKLVNRKIRDYAEKLERKFLFGLTEEEEAIQKAYEARPVYHREPISEANLEFNERTKKWIMYGGYGHGA